MKRCSKCERLYPPTLDHWRRDKTTSDGLTRQCKVCLMAKDARARAAIKRDPARRAKTAATREAWLTRNARRFKRWQCAYMRQYKRDNPDVQRRYRARLLVKRLKQKPS